MAESSPDVWEDDDDTYLCQMCAHGVNEACDSCSSPHHIGCTYSTASIRLPFAITYSLVAPRALGGKGGAFAKGGLGNLAAYVGGLAIGF